MEIGIGIIIALLIGLFVVCYHFSNRVIKNKTLSPDEIVKIDVDDGISSKEWYEQLDKEDYSISSPYGYNLSATYIPTTSIPSKGTMIFSHGVTVSHITSIKYMRLFHEKGYDCLIYDHRRHGNSGGKDTSYGYYEKYDLKAVVDWLEKTKGFNGKLGIHGESMGSAILLLYAGMEDKADFYIADCPYTTIWDQLLYRMKKDYSFLLSPMLYIGNWVIYFRARFNLKGVNCLESVKKIKKPILFIHGMEDNYVPTYMGIALYEVKPEPKEIYLVPNARHAKSLATDPEKYMKVVFDFIKRYCP